MKQADQENKKLCAFQIVNKRNGTRSATAVDTREKFAANLRQYLLPFHPTSFVLVVAEYVNNVANFSTCPLMTVKNFCSEYDRQPGEQTEFTNEPE